MVIAEGVGLVETEGSTIVPPWTSIKLSIGSGGPLWKTLPWTWVSMKKLAMQPLIE